MINEIQHHLVHARDLAQTAAQLYQTAQTMPNSIGRDRMMKSASKLLKEADRLLEETP